MIDFEATRQLYGPLERFASKKTIAGKTMSVTDPSSLSTTELARRIAILRDNIRQITEQAAVQSGAADEERNAERLSIQNDELDNLLNEQERRLGK